MKVLGIVCSPRKGGNTEILMVEALAGAQSCGAETELWTAAGKDLRPCDGCYSCIDRGGKCHIRDDMQELYSKILEADGLIFGSPTYFMSLTAQAKIVIDRMFCLFRQDMLVNKVAGVLNVSGSSGPDGVAAEFHKFILLSHMFPADYTFGFAYDKGDVRKDNFAMRSSSELGKQVVALVKQQLGHPREYIKPLYRICRDTYGLSDYALSRGEARQQQT
ncbi:MAG: flavodoxin family protein [Chloroflexi bacterium]|nr:flavodoxin family protein [Chloroflexota bacterium]